MVGYMEKNPKQLISSKTVKEKIDSAEIVLQECFDMLLDFKHARNNLGHALTSFQPKLAECLYELMEFYQELDCEKDRMISAKDSFSNESFVEIMRNNALFSEIVSNAIEIGKSLGDAFVWFFFRNNRSELDKHFEHEPTGLYVGGIGGRGELEFVKHSINIDGLYVIYHGITTMLRIGDFSLYDAKHGIVGVGELKTKKIDNHLKISASITSKVNINPSKDNLSSSTEAQIKELQKEFPRLEKQLTLHPALLYSPECDSSLSAYTSYEHELINHLSPSTPISINNDSSLMLFAAWSQQRTLFEVLSTKETSGNFPDNFVEKVESLIVPSTPYNELIMGTLTTQMAILRMPVFWWHINDDICRDIYFKRANIATLFNPAKLLQFFIDDGFSISKFGNLNEIEIVKTEDNHRIGIGHFESICDLVRQSLMQTTDVLAFLPKIISSIENGQYQSGTKIDMNIHLNNFGNKCE